MALCGSCRVLGVYLSALESMNIYNRNHISAEQNINKVLWPVFSMTMTDVGQAISSTFVSLLLLVTVKLNNRSGSGA